MAVVVPGAVLVTVLVVALALVQETIHLLPLAGERWVTGVGEM